MLVALVLLEPLMLLAVLVLMKRVEDWVDRSVGPGRPAQAGEAGEVTARRQAPGVALPAATVSLPLPRRAPVTAAARVPSVLPSDAPDPVRLGGGGADSTPL